MEKILKGKLNSKGLIKTLETAHDPSAYLSDKIGIKIDNNLYESFKGSINEESIKNWLVDTFKITDSEFSRMVFQVIPNNMEDTTTIIIKSTTLENLVDGIVDYMSDSLLINKMCKVGYYLQYAEISTNLEYTTLTISMDLDVYERIIDLDGQASNVLYSDENLVKALKELTTNLSTPIPEIISVSSNVSTDNRIDITYNFAPGENESDILEIFNFITVDDFDGVDDEDDDAIEGPFSELNNVIAIDDIARNRKENNESQEETKQKYFDMNEEVLQGLNFLTEIYKSMKMDVDAELDEVTIDHEECADKTKTVITMKGLRITSKVNK